ARLQVGRKVVDVFHQRAAQAAGLKRRQVATDVDRVLLAGPGPQRDQLSGLQRIVLTAPQRRFAFLEGEGGDGPDVPRAGVVEEVVRIVEVHSAGTDRRSQQLTALQVLDR